MRGCSIDQTTIRADDSWLFFNVEGLTNDPKLESAMSMIIAHAMSERASGRTRTAQHHGSR